MSCPVSIHYYKSTRSQNHFVFDNLLDSQFILNFQFIATQYSVYSDAHYCEINMKLFTLCCISI